MSPDQLTILFGLMLAETTYESETEVIVRNLIGPATALLLPGTREKQMMITPENMDEIIDPRYHAAFFRFSKEGIVNLMTYLQVPDRIRYADGHETTGFHGLLCLLMRLSSPERNIDLEYKLKVHNSVVGSLCNVLTLNIWDRIKDRFRSLNQRWLTEDLCNRMAQSIGEHLNIVNCIGAVDGKCLGVCVPCRNQGLFFCGHHHAHVLKFILIGFCNGMVIPFGPWPGHLNDRGCALRMRLPALLNRYLNFGNNRKYVILGDAGFTLGEQVITPFLAHNGNQPSEEERLFNRRLSSVRIMIENLIRDTTGTWRRFQDPKMLKTLASPIGCEFVIACYLTNIRCIMAGGNQVSAQFGIAPPSLQDFLV